MVMTVRRRNRIERHMMPIFMAIMLIVTFEPTVISRTRRCAGFGEYCQTHWDCCSNTCMTYLYRCTRNYDIAPYAFDPSYGLLPTPPVVQSSLEDIVALNFGTSALNDIAGSKLQEHEQYAGMVGISKDKLDEMEKMMTVLTTSETSIADVKFIKNQQIQNTNNDTKIQIPPTILSPATTNKNIQIEGLKTDNEGAHIPATASPSSISSSMSSSTLPLLTKISLNSTGRPSSDVKKTTRFSFDILNNQNCGRVGSKCYRNEHCCTLRCPSFLLKCVT